MTNIKMVVFDMAGTTINEHNVVYKTLYTVINESGLPVSLEKVLELGAGKEKFQAIKDIINEIDPATSINPEMIFGNFKNMLDEAYSILAVTPIDGVDATMLELKEKGIKVVLNTGYSETVANTLLHKLNWEKDVHYDLLVTADDVEKGRPHPDMILKAMDALHVFDPKTVLKAGDSAVDIEEGKNANCGITVGVLSGAQTKEQLKSAEPTYIIESLATLNQIMDY
ncbi:phosphonatase-like hydrolase [Flavivirga eckloniae]|uniref:HAD family hydrolase n=1 Tax=Flavivirga eckloniae TaxID=1803846 RepID=A0A2K9PU27_9FLAO|nr:phosphonatase-like hydrolase [Flavivirga eckloniae]AUP80566.1 HAD family hydrolase [Flavivirga eckloniae]